MNRLKTINFSGKLYRANKSNTRKNIKNILASNEYKNAPVKYFTLTNKEVNAYTKYGTTYKKSWTINTPLKLVDILDLSTRTELEKYFVSKNEKNALNSAFPININNSYVSRNSTNVNIDNIVLEKLCSMGYDGYYMKTINAFHSEVGLCKNALSKLKFNTSTKVIAPTRVNKYKKPSYSRNNENNKNNKKVTLKRRLNLNNSNNMLTVKRGLLMFGND
jgi:hypothetical protein